MQHSFPGSPGKTAFVSSSFPIRFQKDRSFPKNTPIGAYMETRLPKPMKDSPLKRAIESLPIPVLWQRLGLPGHVTANCCVRSPLRDDRSPSFSIYAGGTRWKDHGTGQGGDSFDLYQAVKKLSSAKAAWRSFVDLSRL